MDFEKEIMARAAWIREILEESGAKGIVFGSSGGKDSALVGILSRIATPNVTGIVMPCGSKRNYEKDRNYALDLAEKFDIKTLEVDLTPVKEAFVAAVEALDESQNPMAYANMNPRLRMITLYNYAQRKGYLVAGTGNRSEIRMGYFTKWGDGAYDLNPIGDLTVSEVYKLLTYLECPQEIIDEPPSAALFEGQTDEAEMGVSYADIEARRSQTLAGQDISQITERSHRDQSCRSAYENKRYR